MGYGLTPYIFQGTINAGGTLSNEFDLSNMQSIALISLGSIVSGAMGAMVSDKGDAAGGVYSVLNDAAGALSFGTQVGQVSLSASLLAPLLAFRFVRIKAAAQTNGLAFVLVGKG